MALAEPHPLEDLALLNGYYLLHAVRGRLLAETGDGEGAARAYAAAIECPCIEPERRLLRRTGQATDNTGNTVRRPALDGM